MSNLALFSSTSIHRTLLCLVAMFSACSPFALKEFVIRTGIIMVKYSQMLRAILWELCLHATISAVSFLSLRGSEFVYTISIDGKMCTSSFLPLREAACCLVTHLVRLKGRIPG